MDALEVATLTLSIIAAVVAVVALVVAIGAVRSRKRG